MESLHSELQNVLNDRILNAEKNKEVNMKRVLAVLTLFLLIILGVTAVIKTT